MVWTQDGVVIATEKGGWTLEGKRLVPRIGFLRTKAGNSGPSGKKAKRAYPRLLKLLAEDAKVRRGKKG